MGRLSARSLTRLQRGTLFSLGAALAGGCGRIGYDSAQSEPNAVTSGSGGAGGPADGGTASGGTTTRDAASAGNGNVGATSSGGAASTGGATGVSGTAGVGGTTNSGGASSTGGATNSGGSTVADSGTGAGGATATGGAAGTGGGIGTGGTTGSDAGPCTGATYGGHAYVFCPTVLLFVDAAADCQAKSMRLARIDDVAENQFLATLAFAATGTQNTPSIWPWFGAQSSATPVQWTYTDGTVFWIGTKSGAAVGGLYTNWGSANPGDATGTSCASLSHNGGLSWVDRRCDEVHPYLCEAY